MKRKDPLAISTGNKVIAYAEDYGRRCIPVVVTKVYAQKFQGQSAFDDGREVVDLKGLSRYQAWTVEEFQSLFPEEFYQLYPRKHSQPEVPESVNGLQDENGDELVNGLQDESGDELVNGLQDESGDELVNGLQDKSDDELVNGLQDKSDDELVNGLQDGSDDGHSECGELAQLPAHSFSVGDIVQYEDDQWTISQITKHAILLEQEKDGLKGTVWVRCIEKIDPINLETTEVPQRYLPINQIELHSDLQPRFGLNRETVEQYVQRLENGERPLPIEVFLIDGRYVCADGFHRIESARIFGGQNIRANITKGSWAEAKMFAASANTRHGLPLINKERFRAAELYLDALDELPDGDTRKKENSRDIAKKCGVSHTYITELRQRRKFVEELNQIGAEKGVTRFKHKKLGSLGTYVELNNIKCGIQLEWDIGRGAERFSGWIPLKDLELTTIPKPEPEAITGFKQDEPQLKAVATPRQSSGGIPTKLAETNKSHNSSNERKTEKPPTDELVIGILSNINLLVPDQITSLFDALVHRIPESVLLEEVHKLNDTQLKAVIKSAKEELNKRNHPDYFREESRFNKTA